MIFNKDNLYRISKSRMEKLFKLYGVQDIEGLRAKLDTDFNPFEQDIDEQTKKEKLLNLKIKNKIAVIHDLKVPPSEAVAIVNGEMQLEKSSSKLAQVNPETEFEQQSPYDEANNRIQCTDCGILFKGKMSEQTEAFADHLYQKHRRSPTNFEVRCCQEANKKNPPLRAV